MSAAERPGALLSPLRYPGAKRQLLPAIRAALGSEPIDLLVEPFAGGASVSLALLVEGRADHAILADAPEPVRSANRRWDPLVAAFWRAAVFTPEALIARLRAEPVTVERWDHWQATEPSDTLVYLDPPYVEKATALYGRSFGPDEHERLAAYLARCPTRWVLSYDDTPLVRRLYGRLPGMAIEEVGAAYTAAGRRRLPARKTELLITNRAEAPLEEAA